MQIILKEEEYAKIQKELLRFKSKHDLIRQKAIDDCKRVLKKEAYCEQTERWTIPKYVVQSISAKFDELNEHATEQDRPAKTNTMPYPGTLTHIGSLDPLLTKDG